MKKRKARRARPIPHLCPCASTKPYSECCGPLHEGNATASEAVALVRARFSAFALGLPEYLYRTLHSANDSRGLAEAAFVAELQRGLSSLQYRTLRILDSAAPDRHGVARALFLVGVSHLRRDRSFVEQADFAQEEGEWRYIVGVTSALDGLSHRPEEMRLDHWQCDHHHHH